MLAGTLFAVGMLGCRYRQLAGTERWVILADSRAISTASTASCVCECHLLPQLAIQNIYPT